MTMVVKYHLPMHAQERIVKRALEKENDKMLSYQSLFKKVNKGNKKFTHKQLDEMLKHLNEKNEIKIDYVSKIEFDIYGKYGRNDLITLL